MVMLITAEFFYTTLPMSFNAFESALAFYNCEVIEDIRNLIVDYLLQFVKDNVDVLVNDTVDPTCRRIYGVPEDKSIAIYWFEKDVKIYFKEEADAEHYRQFVYNQCIDWTQTFKSNQVVYKLYDLDDPTFKRTFVKAVKSGALIENHMNAIKASICITIKNNSGDISSLPHRYYRFHKGEKMFVDLSYW